MKACQLLFPLFFLAASAVAQDQVVSVTVIEVDPGPVLEEVPLTGTVNSPQFAQVSAAVAGQVSQVLVDAGSAVSKGDLLLRLDDEIARLELESAQADVARLTAQLGDSERRLLEVQELALENSIAATEVETRAAQVNVDKAALASAKADANRRAALLKRHRVRAPFAGVIRRKNTEAGAWVVPGTPVVELVAVTGLRIDFQTPQEYFSRLKQGAEMLIRLESGEQHSVTIETAVPVADPVARTFLLRVTADSLTGLAPGMSANGVLRLPTGRSSVAIPIDALLRYPDGRTTVWIVENKDGVTKVREQTVRVGTLADGKMEVLSGLGGEEQIVIRGNEALQNGTRVQITTHTQGS